MCQKAWPGWDSDSLHPNHAGQSIDYPGVLIIPDFLTEKEAEVLMNGIDGEPWDVSQSGRRKQNYGPKCNFRQRKLSPGHFAGFPQFSLFVQKKLNTVLDDYFVIEQCSLEYDPTKGASIDPHIDDCWIWGERIVTVNVIGDSVLTMLPYKGDEKKYNLSLVPEGKRKQDVSEDCIVRIPMPARSLIVIFGDARYKWEHCVLREDIKERRVCLAYREFTEPYLPGGERELAGREILRISQEVNLS